MMLQLPGGPAVPSWSREAIHDTVAVIARQRGYARDARSSLLERFFQWIGDLFELLTQSLGSVPHGRRVAAVLAIVLAVLVLARLLFASRLRSEEAAGAAPRRAGRLTTTEVWREAESLAAAGRHTEAAHALYRATLTLLAANGLVRLHESKTSGDYARELRRLGSSVYEAFRTFGARYDRIIYGTGSCDAAGYAALVAAARPVFDAPPRERAA